MQCNQQHLSSVSITCRVSIWSAQLLLHYMRISKTVPGGVAQERQLLNRHYCPWPSHRPLHCLHAPCTCMGTTTVACRVSSNTQWCKQHGRHGSTPAPSALQCGDSWSSGKCSTEANHCLLADQHGLDPDKHSLKPSPTNMKCWEWKLACPKFKAKPNATMAVLPKISQDRIVFKISVLTGFEGFSRLRHWHRLILHMTTLHMLAGISSHCGIIRHWWWIWSHWRP